MKSFFTAMIIITGLFLPCLAAEAYEYEGNVSVTQSFPLGDISKVKLSMLSIMILLMSIPPVRLDWR